ncbi:hypothetical protein P280DRAFT_471949 [Massarina eburnea CBS 473.64]|uniref:Uncharacterized protein n=1 Tax=Massarina eburnea CBS 473.64 TaxID=1395130 RepID=A0A6A6RQB4_9PLEO|nr:hypothetical protein P280DRAFT_471949 [Massarina eburnea CBS 473.64]
MDSGQATASFLWTESFSAFKELVQTFVKHDFAEFKAIIPKARHYLLSLDKERFIDILPTLDDVQQTKWEDPKKQDSLRRSLIRVGKNLALHEDSPKTASDIRKETLAGCDIPPHFVLAFWPEQSFVEKAKDIDNLWRYVSEYDNTAQTWEELADFINNPECLTDFKDAMSESSFEWQDFKYPKTSSWGLDKKLEMAFRWLEILIEWLIESEDITNEEKEFYQRDLEVAKTNPAKLLQKRKELLQKRAKSLDSGSKMVLDPDPEAMDMVQDDTKDGSGASEFSICWHYKN